jgi:hypothetical protein
MRRVLFTNLLGFFHDSFYVNQLIYGSALHEVSLDIQNANGIEMNELKLEIQNMVNE